MEPEETPTESNNPELEQLTAAARHYNNAMAIIIHNEYPGHQCEAVFSTLQFLKQVKDGIESDIKKLDLVEVEQVDVK